jgi:subtilisin family serine protease
LRRLSWKEYSFDLSPNKKSMHCRPSHLTRKALRPNSCSLNLHTGATDEIRTKLEALGADIFEDVQFRVFPGDDEYDDLDEDAGGWTQSPQGDLADDYSTRDVIEQVAAPKAWARTRGEGVTIAVVDTGIAGARQECAPHHRSSVDLDSEYLGKHWIDPHGHGSMCAAIAAGSQTDGGRYDGVAPGATVLAARSSLKSTDLVLILFFNPAFC